MKKVYFIIGLITILSILLYFYFNQTTPTEAFDQSKNASSKQISTQNTNSSAPVLTTEKQPQSSQKADKLSTFLPQAQLALEQHPLLKGTQILANWEFTQDEQLIINSNIKDTFDYLLVVYPQVGKTGVMALAQHILQEKQATLPPNAQKKQFNEALLLDALERYINYQEQAEQFAKQIKPKTMQNAERMELVRKIRVQYLGQDLTDAFYPEQETHASAQPQN